MKTREYHKIIGLVFCLLTVQLCTVQAQDFFRKQDFYMKTRLSVGMIAVNLFKNDPNTTSGTKPVSTYDFGVKEELGFDRVNSKLMAGVDLIFGGVKFDSYYMAPGYSFLFDGNLDYEHQVNIQELQIPLIFKQSFTDEETKRKTFYFTVGWAFRHILGSQTSIVSKTDGTEVWGGKNDVTFEFPVWGTKNSALLSTGIGYQHNYLNKKNGFFADLTFKYGISRFHYVGDGSSNNIYFKDNQIVFSVGLKF